MSFTVIITRDVQPRYRGFLASIMLEVAPGVYVSPRLNPKVRDGVWDVLEKWHGYLNRGSVVMISRNTSVIGKMLCKTLGDTQNKIIDFEHLLLTRKIKQHK